MRRGTSSTPKISRVLTNASTPTGTESRLGTGGVCFYGEPVIRALRFAGVLIAGLWLGALAFHTFVVGPALNSPTAAQRVFGANAAYGAEATTQILTAWYFHLGVICAFLALAHLLVENLYLGRGVSRRWLALLLTLFMLNLMGSLWLNPRLVELHQGRYRKDSPPTARAAAEKSFGLWHGVFQALNVAMLAGVTALLWRTSNPSDTPRYVSSGKFRG
jgi:hypothetical protein